jgi:Flp pilus assembly protein TadG
MRTMLRSNALMATGPSAAPSPRPAEAIGGRRVCRSRTRRFVAILRPDSRGQAIAEFALLVPILFVLIMGLIEFAVAFNAVLGIQRASQNGAHMASIAGNILGADCLILDQIENDLQPPLNKAKIQEVQIERSSMAGNVVYAVTAYSRTGSTSCELNNDTTMTVPYTRTQNDYPVNQRCNVLSGCAAMTPTRSTVDNIGVMIRYRYDWITPLGDLLPFVGGDADGSRGWTFSKRNVFRMEPNL